MRAAPEIEARTTTRSWSSQAEWRLRAPSRSGAGSRLRKGENAGPAPAIRMASLHLAEIHHAAKLARAMSDSTTTVAALLVGRICPGRRWQAQVKFRTSLMLAKLPDTARLRPFELDLVVVDPPACLADPATGGDHRSPRLPSHRAGLVLACCAATGRDGQEIERATKISTSGRNCNMLPVAPPAAPTACADIGDERNRPAGSSNGGLAARPGKYSTGRTPRISSVLGSDLAMNDALPALLQRYHRLVLPGAARPDGNGLHESPGQGRR